jgi:predicted SprT family Zn-dependent metalloprotease
MKRSRKTRYMEKCVCGHVRDSHRHVEDPRLGWIVECKTCGCNGFMDHWEAEDDSEEDSP